MKNKTQVHKWKEMQTEQNIIALRGIMIPIAFNKIIFYFQSIILSHKWKTTQLPKYSQA